MKSKIQSRNLTAAAVLSGIALTLLGCSGGDGSSSDSSSSALEPSWSLCARGGRECSFEGTHMVRYGKDGQYVTAVFTDGVFCSGKAFGVPRVSGARCYYDRNEYVEPATGGDTTADAGTVPTEPTDHGDHTGTDTNVMPDAGTDAAPTTDTHDHTAMDAGTGTSTGDTTTPPTDTNTGTHEHPSGGPYIDESAIPTGFEGFDTVRIVSTSEQPSPGDGTGAFRNVCQFSHMDFNDPIVFPGQPGASHLHTFFGNTGTDAFSTQSSLRDSGNSTCRGGIANRSAYWVPALIDANGRPIAPTEMHVYYKTGYAGIAPASVQKFPSVLRMIAGDPMASSPQPKGFWGCHENYIGHPATIPECPVGQHVAMYVGFPQCWDGQNLDSADHRSHMAYPAGGSCPASHPVPIPELSFTVVYLVPPEGTSGWRLASDHYDPSLPGGYSAHGDWFEGWDPAVAEAFVKNCDNKAVDCHSHLLGDGRAIY